MMEVIQKLFAKLGSPNAQCFFYPSGAMTSRSAHVGQIRMFIPLRTVTQFEQPIINYSGEWNKK